MKKDWSMLVEELKQKGPTRDKIIEMRDGVRETYVTSHALYLDLKTHVFEKDEKKLMRIMDQDLYRIAHIYDGLLDTDVNEDTLYKRVIDLKDAENTYDDHRAKYLDLLVEKYGNIDGEL